MNPEIPRRVTVNTSTAAYLLNRQPRTLHKWACLQNGPLVPVKIHGRLAWPLDAIYSLLSFGPSDDATNVGVLTHSTEASELLSENGYDFIYEIKNQSRFPVTHRVPENQHMFSKKNIEDYVVLRDRETIQLMEVRND